MKFVELDDQPVSTDIRMCDGLFVRHCVFAEGSYIPQHSHDTEHLSIIATGAVRAWQDGKLMGDFTAPAGIVIAAKRKHLFFALEPNTTVLCVHRVDGDELPRTHEEHHLEEI